MKSPLKVADLKIYPDRSLVEFACDAVERVVAYGFAKGDIGRQLREVIETKRRYVAGDASKSQYDHALVKMSSAAKAAYNATVIDERMESTANSRLSEAIIDAALALMKVKSAKRNPQKVAENVTSVLEFALEAANQAELFRLYPHQTTARPRGETLEDLRKAAAKVQQELEWQHARLNKIPKNV